MKILSFLLLSLSSAQECATTRTSRRIIGGKSARPGNFPWQVFFGNENCGGTLVSLTVSYYYRRRFEVLAELLYTIVAIY